MDGLDPETHPLRQKQVLLVSHACTLFFFFPLHMTKKYTSLLLSLPLPWVLHHWNNVNHVYLSITSIVSWPSIFPSLVLPLSLSIVPVPSGLYSLFICLSFSFCSPYTCNYCTLNVTCWITNALLTFLLSYSPPSLRKTIIGWDINKKGIRGKER